MAHKVGRKGQIVIEKQIRDRLGVKPGWLALQRLVGDHVEVYFVPPEHDRSLKGNLAEHTNVRIPPGEEWDKARANAWHEAKQYYEDHIKELEQQYPGQYIAIWKGRVIANGTSFGTVARSSYDQVGYQDMYIPRVGRPKKVIRLHPRRVVRHSR